MITRIQKWGNSQGLRLAKGVLAEADIGVGDEVKIEIRNGLIVIEPCRTIRGRHRIEDLVAQIPPDLEPGEVDWGEPSGGETW